MSIGPPNAGASFKGETRVSVRRFLGHLVDTVIFLVVLVVLLIGLQVLFIGFALIAPAFVPEIALQVLGFAVTLIATGSVPADTAGDVPTLKLLLFVVVTVGHVCFLVLLHGSNGRTPGKYAAGIRVVDFYGRPPTYGQLWKRSWPILFEYVYVLAWIGMMASPRRQRFGDRLAHTYVVRA